MVQPQYGDGVFDIFENLVVRDSLTLLFRPDSQNTPIEGRNGSRCYGCGYNPKIITLTLAQSDLLLRTEMFRVNTLQKELTGDELFAAVMTSHAAHIPTHRMITDLNVKVTLSLLTRRLTTPHPRRLPPKACRRTDLTVWTKYAGFMARANVSGELVANAYTIAGPLTHPCA